jgi:integrase
MPPAPKRRRYSSLTLEQTHHFLATAERESPLFPLFATGFGTGPRLGELLALQRDDDAWHRQDGTRVRQLHICRQLNHRGSRKDPHPHGRKMDTGDGEGGYYVDAPAALGTILDTHKQTLRPDAPALPDA